MLLSLAHVSFAYADAVPILTEVTHAFEPGWHGLVGANGSGKTTVLGLLAGALQPDRGVGRRVPPGLPGPSGPPGGQGPGHPRRAFRGSSQRPRAEPP